MRVDLGSATFRLPWSPIYLSLFQKIFSSRVLLCALNEHFLHASHAHRLLVDQVSKIVNLRYCTVAFEEDSIDKPLCDTKSLAHTRPCIGQSIHQVDWLQFRTKKSLQASQRYLETPAACSPTSISSRARWSMRSTSRWCIEVFLLRAHHGGHERVVPKAYAREKESHPDTFISIVDYVYSCMHLGIWLLGHLSMRMYLFFFPSSVTFWGASATHNKPHQVVCV